MKATKRVLIMKATKLVLGAVILGSTLGTGRGNPGFYSAGRLLQQR